MSLIVIIGTADRPGPLETTLRGLADCELPVEDLLVVVADNGVEPETAQVCGRHYPGLRVRRLAVARRGKSIALNRAVETTDADLLAFTDDDVEFDVRWLAELHRAAHDWPGHELFGGRVVPMWPAGLPPRLDGSRYLSPLYTQLDRGNDERPIVGFHPFGPCMLARRQVFERGIRFDEAIGPGSSGGIPIGDETSITRELEALGHAAVYVPDSVVFHRVRKEQLSLEWQLRRGVHLGRMHAYFAPLPDEAHAATWFGVPRWLFRKTLEHLIAAGGHAVLGRRRMAFDRLMDAVVAIGRYQQARRRRDITPHDTDEETGHE